MKTKISTLQVDPELLRPNPWNSNVVSPENEERIAKSLERFDFFRPIIVRQVEGESLFEIIGGEHRWKVAKDMGYTEVPIINLGYIDDNKAKEIGLVDNGRYGEDDTFMLSELLSSLGADLDELHTYMPMGDDEISHILASTSAALDSLEIPDDDEVESLPSVLDKAPQTHQIMRFKIPIEDAQFVQNLIESAMRSQGFTEDDSMMNAGNAIVYLLKNLK